MPEPISSIRNLGPAMETAFAEVGIHSAEELRALGTDRAYAKLLEAGQRPHFIGYYVIEMGLQGRPWNDCKGKEKAALRVRFDRLKAKNKPAANHRLEKVFDEIGLLARSDTAQPTSSVPAKK
ncbi:MAG: TfoX/Sxy family DNA transformation protein [Pseudomonadota bacterium]